MTWSPVDGGWTWGSTAQIWPVLWSNGRGGSIHLSICQSSIGCHLLPILLPPFLLTHPSPGNGSQDYYTSHLSFAEGRNWWYWGFLFQMHRCLKSCMQSKLGKPGRILSTLQEIFNIMEPFTNNCLKKNPSKVPRSHNSFLYLYPSEDFYIMELSWSKAYFSVLMMSILSSSSSTIGWQDPGKCQK